MKTIKKYRLLIAATILYSLAFAEAANAQTKPVQAPKVYYVPFTLQQLQNINREAFKADSILTDAHKATPSIDLLRQLLQAFNASFQQQVALDTAKVKAPVKTDKKQ